MKIMIAVILMADSQYSTAPNRSTLRALTRISSDEKPTIETQAGSPGYQKCMYWPTAVTSVPTASTMQVQ